MSFWKSLSGMLLVEFTSASPETVLDAITQARIPLNRVVKMDELRCRILIRRRDYGKIAKILNQQGAALEIGRKIGLFWLLIECLRRPVLLGLGLGLFVLTVCLPSRILFVSVEGNPSIPDRAILEAAKDCGIRFGASRKVVRSEKVKNALLAAVPQLQWAGVNTSGCTAVISVRERTQQVRSGETGIVSNVVADRDGYILSATVTGGTPLVVPGDAVVRGQVLISGYTDCGICIRASRAEGEILAQTNRELGAVMPEKITLSEAASETKYKISLCIGKKRINLWKDSSISDALCDRMYTEYFVSLPGGFRLPVAVCVDRFRDYKLQESVIPEQEARQRLRKFSETYLLQQMVAGQLRCRQQILSCTDGLYRLDSSFICTEMIGKERREQIGVINGKGN